MGKLGFILDVLFNSELFPRMIIIFFNSNFHFRLINFTKSCKKLQCEHCLQDRICLRNLKNLDVEIIFSQLKYNSVYREDFNLHLHSPRRAHLSWLVL